MKVYGSTENWFFIQDGSDAKEEVRKWLCRSDASYQDKLLACGAVIVSDLRMQVLKETQFTCSAGIAHNKVKTVLICLYIHVLFVQIMTSFFLRILDFFFMTNNWCLMLFSDAG